MGAVDKFAALAEALDIADDTDALERPDPERTTVRGALQARSPRSTNASSSRPTAVRPAAPHLERADTRPLAESPATVAPPAVAPTDVARKSPRTRSSANLPVSVWERVSAAKADRWELSDILARALRRPIDASSAEQRYRSMQNELRVQRQYRVTSQEREILDRLAAEFRMTRSEVVGVLLDAELNRMFNQS